LRYPVGQRAFEPVGDAPLGQVVRRHLDEHLVAREHADAVFPHLSGRVRNDFVFGRQLHAKGRVGQQFDDRAFEFEQFFLRHALLRALICGGYIPKRGDSSIAVEN
jgi:hypothetical protein